MIDIWVKLISNQVQLAMNLTRAYCGLGVIRDEPAPAEHGPVDTTVQAQAEAPTVNPISGILSYLESASRGATVS